MFIKNKKSSLELSITTIVIVVLSMTLLSLGLLFIRGFFEDLTKTRGQISAQVREQITAQLRESGDKLSFPREVQLPRGGRDVLTAGVQNTGSETMHFGFNLTMDTSNSDHGTDADGNIKNIKDVYDPRYLSGLCSYSLAPSDTLVEGINIKAPKTSGTDMLIIKVLLSKVNADGTCSGVASDNPIYATKTTFITVG